MNRSTGPNTRSIHTGCPWYTRAMYAPSGLASSTMTNSSTTISVQSISVIGVLLETPRLAELVRLEKRVEQIAEEQPGDHSADDEHLGSAFPRLQAIQ